MSLLARLAARRQPRPTTCCGRCAAFDNDPHALEREIPMLRSLSSAMSSVRDGDGLCRRHDRIIRTSALCADFAPAVE